jgi:hypothetical protein
MDKQINCVQLKDKQTGTLAFSQSAWTSGPPLK